MNARAKTRPLDDDAPPMVSGDAAREPVVESAGQLVDVSEPMEPIDYARRSLAFVDTTTQLQDLAKLSAGISTITNKAGLQECKARRIALRDARVAVEKRGKGARADFLAMQKAVIGVEAELLAIIEPEEKRLAALEADAIARQAAAVAAAQEKEAARQKEISDRFAYIRGLPLQAVNATAEFIDELLIRAEAFVSDGLPEDMVPAANYERQVALNALKASRDARVVFDAAQAQLAIDQAELAKLREADAARREKEEADAAFLLSWAEAIAENQSRDAAFGRLWEEAHAADRDRTLRLANEAESRRLKSESDRMEVEKRTAAAKVRQLEIDSATLRDAAIEAVKFLQDAGYGEALVTEKLRAALARDEFAGYDVPGVSS